MTPDVEATYVFHLVTDGDLLPMTTRLRYFAADAHAIQLVFVGGSLEVPWTFARDLLRRGLAGPVGDGDVHVWPSWSSGGEVIRLSLTSPDGQAVVQAQAAGVREFLDRTNAVVPADEEGFDVDAFIAHCLQEAS